VKCREQVDREASPTACIVDSQSVKSGEKGGLVSIHMGLPRDNQGENARQSR
jgi:hypothetical protein